MNKRKLTDKQRVGALYVRVSTDKQEELSPDAQIRLGLEYAKDHDIHVPNEYIFREDGISGKYADKRPAFKSLIGLARSKDHPIDCILVWKFSRFARNQEESITYKSMLARDNVEVVSISEPIPDGPFGSLNERIIEWMDEYYLTNLSSEVVRGMTENAMRGNYQAPPGIGYMSPGPKQVPVKDPKTFIILEYIDKWFMEEHLTTRQIALRLNQMGYRTKRGNLFDARGIEYILSNPFNAGKIRWNYTERGRKLKAAEDVIVVDGRHEPAWSWEHHQEIQKRLDELATANAGRGKKKRDVSSCHHWLSGLLFCSCCGRTLANAGAANQRNFQCWGYAKGMCNTSHNISVPKAERFVISGLEYFLESDSIPYSVVYQSSAADDKENELRLILSRLNDREKRAKDAYLNEIDSLEEYKENKLLIQSERGRIQSELDALLSSKLDTTEHDDKQMIHRIEEVLSILKDEDADYTQKGIAVRGIIDKIIFDKENYSFDFHLKLVK